MKNGKLNTILRSLLFSYALTGILLAALAFALYKLRLNEGQIRLAVFAIYVITCLLGGLVMGRGFGQRRFFWGLILGLLYFIILWMVSLALNKGVNGDLSQVVTIMGVCAASGTVGGMLS